jgi:hypothetical protein
VARHHTPDVDVDTTHTNTPDTNSPSRSGGGGGGDGVTVEVTDLDSVRDKMGQTQEKVAGVKDGLAQTRIGPEDYGPFGAFAAGGANDHIDQASQVVDRAQTAVGNAQQGVQQTADGYRATDEASATNLSQIETDANPPTTGGSTTPSSTPGDAGGANPPPAPRDVPDTSGGTDAGGPSGPTNPPGSPGGPPSNPPAGSSHPNQPLPWRQAMEQHFTPNELAEIDQGLRNGSNDNPGPGQVPGAGQLTDRQRDLLVQAQHPDVVQINPDTRMQKILGPGAEQSYANNYDPSTNPDPNSSYFDSNKVGSFVSRVVDNPAGQTPGEMIQANRLDYPGSTFNGSNPIYVMEFDAGSSSYQTPIGAPSVHGDPNLSDTSTPVVDARDDMLARAQQHLPPNSYTGWIQDYPFSGYGVTADGTNGVPERVRPFDDVDPGSSVIYRIDPDGTRSVYLEYHGRNNGGWQPPASP